MVEISGSFDPVWKKVSDLKSSCCKNTNWDARKNSPLTHWGLRENISVTQGLSSGCSCCNVRLMHQVRFPYKCNECGRSTQETATHTRETSRILLQARPATSATDESYNLEVFCVVGWLGSAAFAPCLRCCCCVRVKNRQRTCASSLAWNCECDLIKEESIRHSHRRM